MDLGLAGKSALVTGGSKGIGLGAAMALANEGALVQIAARDPDTLARASEQIADVTGRSVETHAIDLSGTGAPEALLKRAGDIDILVNNAGAIPAGTIGTVDEATWRSAWDLKVFGYINLSRAAFTMMSARTSGVILNVTGLAADKPDFSYIAGTAGNASLNAFTRALGSYSLDHGVRVLAVSPGPVETDRLVTLMKSRARAETGTDATLRDYMSGLPMGRAANVDEVADAIAFLVSERASYISGTVLTIDGGHGSRGGSFTK